MTEQGTASATEPQAALDEARAGIDAIDDQIHDLLMRRAHLVQSIGSAKRGGGGAYRPAREAHILRRLFARNEPPLDFSIVYRLWREMIGGFTAMQAPLRVSAPEGSGLDRLARDHFGAAALIGSHSGDSALADAMRADASLLAIVPVDGWRACLGEAAPNVVSALPVYGDRIEALCLASAKPQESGADMTLFSVMGGTPNSAEFVLLGASGADCLVAHDGFRIGEPGLLDQLAGASGVGRDRVACIGAAPKLISGTQS